MRTVFIVWNENQTEGFVTDDRQDAYDASTGQRRDGQSSVGMDFWDTYGTDLDEGDTLVVEEVQVTNVGEDT